MYYNVVYKSGHFSVIEAQNSFSLRSTLWYSSCCFLLSLWQPPDLPIMDKKYILGGMSEKSWDILHFTIVVGFCLLLFRRKNIGSCINPNPFLAHLCFCAVYGRKDGSKQFSYMCHCSAWVEALHVLHCTNTGTKLLIGDI